MKEQFIDNTILRILFYLYLHDLYTFKICLIKGMIQTQTNRITNTEIKQNKRTNNLRNEFLKPSSPERYAYLIRILYYSRSSYIYIILKI